MDISKVGVVGCGLMGSGIAEVSAKGGFTVVVREVNDDVLEAGRGRIERSMGRAVEKEKLTAEDRDAAWEKLAFTTDVNDFYPAVVCISWSPRLRSKRDGLFGPPRAWSTAALFLKPRSAACRSDKFGMQNSERGFPAPSCGAA